MILLCLMQTWQLTSGTKCLFRNLQSKKPSPMFSGIVSFQWRALYIRRFSLRVTFKVGRGKNLSQKIREIKHSVICNVFDTIYSLIIETQFCLIVLICLALIEETWNSCQISRKSVDFCFLSVMLYLLPTNFNLFAYLIPPLMNRKSLLYYN